MASLEARLHEAVLRRRVEDIEALLAQGADVAAKNAQGWTALQVCVGLRFRAGVEALLPASHRAEQRRFAERLPARRAALAALPDFRMEMRWEFRSWVPLVSRLAPRDTYTVRKRGTNFRVDVAGTSNVGGGGGARSLLFLGDAGDFVEVCWARRTKSLLFSASQRVVLTDVRAEAEEVLRHPPLKTRFVRDASGPAIAPVRSRGGNVRRETIGRWPATVYSVSNVVLSFVTGRECTAASPSSAEAAAAPLAVEEEEKQRTFRGKMWLTDTFPRRLADFLPVLEVLAASQHQVEGFLRFAERVLPGNGSEGFPIKVQVPLFPGLSVAVTFCEYEEGIEVSPELFEIPSDFTEPTDDDDYSE